MKVNKSKWKEFFWGVNFKILILIDEEELTKEKRFLRVQAPSPEDYKTFAKCRKHCITLGRNLQRKCERTCAKALYQNSFVNTGGSL